MITSRLLRLRMAFPKPRRTATPPRLRRRSARRTLACGLIAFVAACAALSVTLDSYRIEWRDPEFGHRLNQIRALQAKSPDRPLLLFVGSSRTQMAICPSAMGFPDEPGSPQPYNLGYRAAPPCASVLHVLRMLDMGNVPAMVVVEFSPASLLADFAPERLPDMWPGRLSYSDLLRLRELGTMEDGTPSASGIRTAWATVAFPWSQCRYTIMSHWLPEWVTPGRLMNLENERMDAFGFRSYPWGTPTSEQRQLSLERVRKAQTRLFGRTQIDPDTEVAIAGLVRRCLAANVPLAFFRIPESPTFQSWFTPASVAAGSAYSDQLKRKFGVTVFPAPDHLVEEDFADGHHMLKHGAERYSRWLADTHIKPWLAQSRRNGP